MSTQAWRSVCVSEHACENKWWGVRAHNQRDDTDFATAHVLHLPARQLRETIRFKNDKKSTHERSTDERARLAEERVAADVEIRYQRRRHARVQLRDLVDVVRQELRSEEEICDRIEAMSIGKRWTAADRLS